MREMADSLVELPKEPMTPEEVLKRLDVPVLPVAPVLDEWHSIKSGHAAISANGQWEDLLVWLRYADLSRAKVGGGKSLATLISEGARSQLNDRIKAQDWPAADAELARLAAVFDDHPADYTAAHLLAHGHLDVANAKRHMTQVGQMSQGVWKDSAAHYAQAEAVLSSFDPIEELSPLLANTRYQLVRGIEEGRSLCRDWFEDWCDLDPEDSDAQTAHAHNMLPHWFGTLSGFDNEASKAAALTSTKTGQAAYAVFYMAAREDLGDFPPGMDLRRFLTGLEHFRIATKCQYRVNLAAGLLAAMLQDSHGEDPSKDVDLGLVRIAMSRLLCTHMTEVHLAAWPDGNDGLALAMTEVFGQDLQGGAHIVVRDGGLAAQHQSS